MSRPGLSGLDVAAVGHVTAMTVAAAVGSLFALAAAQAAARTARQEVTTDGLRLRWLQQLWKDGRPLWAPRPG